MMKIRVCCVHDQHLRGNLSFVTLNSCHSLMDVSVIMSISLKTYFVLRSIKLH